MPHTALVAHGSINDQFGHTTESKQTNKMPLTHPSKWPDLMQYSRGHDHYHVIWSPNLGKHWLSVVSKRHRLNCVPSVEALTAPLSCHIRTNQRPHQKRTLLRPDLRRAASRLWENKCLLFKLQPAAFCQGRRAGYGSNYCKQHPSGSTDSRSWAYDLFNLPSCISHKVQRPRHPAWT